MLNSPQQFLSGLASNSYPAQGYPPHHHQGTPPQPIIPYSSAAACVSGGGGFHHTIFGTAPAGRLHSAAAMMQQTGGGGAGFGMVTRAALMPTPGSQPHAGVNGVGGHPPPPHPHHPVSLGLEVRCGIFIKATPCSTKNPRKL